MTAPRHVERDDPRGRLSATGADEPRHADHAAAGQVRRRSRTAGRTALVLAVAVQVVWLLVGGLWGVLQAPVPSTTDEAAHVDVVLHLLREEQRPVLTDPAQADVLAAALRTTPDAVPPEGLDPSEVRLLRWSYEAFQPPLYYWLAAPVAAAAGGEEPGDVARVVRTLRAVDLGLLVLAAVAVAGLARAALPRAPLLGTALGFVPLTLPGLLQSQTAVTDTALEQVLTPVLLLLCVVAVRRDAPVALVGAGAALGGLLLTRTTTVAVAPVLLLAAVVVLARRASARRAALVTAALLLPAAMVAPEVARSYDLYGTATATEQARAQQQGLGALPGGDLDVHWVLGEAWSLWRTGVLPEQVAYRRLPPTTLLVVALLAVVVVPLLLAARAAWRGRGDGRETAGRAVVALLVLPLPLTVALLASAAAVTDVPLLRGRYAYATLPPVLVAAAAGLTTGGRARPAVRRAAAVAVVATTALMVVLGLHARDEQCRPGRATCGDPPPALAAVRDAPLPGTVVAEATTAPDPSREVPVGGGRRAVLDPAEDEVRVVGADGGVDSRTPLRGGPVAGAYDAARGQLAVLLREGAVVVLDLDVAGDHPVAVQRFPTLPGAVDVAVAPDGALRVVSADGRVQEVGRRFTG